MRLPWKITIGAIVVLAIMFMLTDSPDTPPVPQTVVRTDSVGPTYPPTQLVGFTIEGADRVVTFSVVGFARDSFSDELFAQLREHGSTRYNGDVGSWTSYYFPDNEAPDISGMSVTQATAAAMAARPVLAVTIVPGADVQYDPPTQ